MTDTIEIAGTEVRAQAPDFASAAKYIPLKPRKDEWKAIERIRKELETDPPAEAIKRKDGFDYLHGYYVFARANQTFGALNVSYVHRGSKVLHTGTAKTRSGDRCYVVCESTAGVFVALPGGRVLYTEGTATCDGMGRSYGDAFNIAHKGAYTDARKIALRPLGRTFGAYFSMDDFSIPSDEDAEEVPTPAATPAAQTQPPARGPKKVDLPDDVSAWWKEIRALQESLGWTRKDLAEAIKSQYPDKPASDLGPEQLETLHRELVRQVTRRDVTE